MHVIASANAIGQKYDASNYVVRKFAKISGVFIVIL